MNATSGYPFFDVDFTQFTDFENAMKQLSLPVFDNNVFVEAQRKNIEAVTTANKLAFEGAQALARRQTEITREMFDEFGKAMTELANGSTPEQKLAKQADLVKEVFETSLANLRELTEISAKSQAEAAEVLNKRFTEGLDEYKKAIQKAAKGK